MVSYMDRTFCADPDCRCGRKLTPEIEAAAAVWWKESGMSGDAPISIRPHCPAVAAVKE